MKYKCLIAENNLLERDLLELLLRQIPMVDITAVCEDGLKAMQVLLQEETDIVFTDIDMPQLSGIHLLKSLKKPPVFIFISAYKEYAAEGFDLDVVDFIVKPVTMPRLLKAFGKAKDYIEQQQAAQVSLPGATGVPAADAFFFARTSDGLQKLQLYDIAYAESRANFSVLYLLDGSHYMILVSLKKLSEQLPAGHFIRVHKLYLVNWQHVTLIRPESVMIAGKHSIAVGVTYKNAVAQRVAAHRTLERNPGL